MVHLFVLSSDCQLSLSLFFLLCSHNLCLHSIKYQKQPFYFPRIRKYYLSQGIVEKLTNKVQWSFKYKSHIPRICFLTAHLPKKIYFFSQKITQQKKMTRVIYFFHSWLVGQSFSSRNTCCLHPRWTAWMSYKSMELGTRGRNQTASTFNLAQLCTLEIARGPFPNEHLLGQYPISCQNESH